MALFKILRGNANNLPAEKKDGFAYFTMDDGKFYIDSPTSATNSVLKRTCINKEQDSVSITYWEEGSV